MGVRDENTLLQSLVFGCQVISNLFSAHLTTHLLVLRSDPCSVFEILLNSYFVSVYFGAVEKSSDTLFPLTRF